MKYVFYHIFYPANAPKSALDLIHFVASAVGTEMQPDYYQEFVKEVRRRVDEINKKGRIHLDVSLSTCESGRPMRNGQVCISSPRKWGADDIVRLSFIRVDSLWTENFQGNLQKISFDKWDRMKYEVEKKQVEESREADELLIRMITDLSTGRDIEETVDDYVKCETPELRQKLIDGIKEGMEEGGES